MHQVCWDGDVGVGFEHNAVSGKPVFATFRIPVLGYPGYYGKSEQLGGPQRHMLYRIRARGRMGMVREYHIDGDRHANRVLGGTVRLSAVLVC